MNKAVAGNDAAFAVKTGFSARALIGLLGNDEFSFKVSPDGSAFFDAIRLDRTNGQTHLAAHGKPATPQDLAAHRCLSVSSGEVAPWVLRRGEDIKEVDVQGPVHANSPVMVLRLAAAGLGIAAADEVMASSFLASGELQPVLPDWTLAPYRFMR